MPLLANAVLGLGKALIGPVVSAVVGPVVGKVFEEEPLGIEVDGEPATVTKATTVRAAPPLKGLRTFIVGALLAVAPSALDYIAGYDYVGQGVSPTTAFVISGAAMMAMRLITALSGR